MSSLHTNFKYQEQGFRLDTMSALRFILGQGL